MAKTAVIVILVLGALLGGGGFLVYTAESMKPQQQPVQKVLPDDRFPK